MAVTRKWVEENAPLTFGQLKQYRFSLTETVGSITLKGVNKSAGIVRLMADLLDELQEVYAEVTVEIREDAVYFTRYLSEHEVLDNERKLENGDDPA